MKRMARIVPISHHDACFSAPCFGFFYKPRYEEAQVIKDTFVQSYGLRKIELTHQAKQTEEQEFDGNVVFQSVDQIVVDGLLSVQSTGLRPETLVEIYKSLPNL